MNKWLTYFELDVPRCSLTYGTAPCTASVGVSGEFKCYNSPATCQDPANFAEETQIIRWVKSASYNPTNIQAIPSIEKINRNPQKINAGENIGKRESGSVTFTNHKHNDFGFDKYISDRGFNAFETGSFWGKFSARYPNIDGYECRTYQGPLTESPNLENDFEVFHYIAKKGDYNDRGDKYIIKFQDALSLVEGGKTLFPYPTNGVLNTNIDTSLTPFDLEPLGIGDSLNPDGTLAYPTSGYAFIGDEYMSYTRSGDTITPTGRGLLNTNVDSHDAGETLQVAGVFESNKPSEILDRLFSVTILPSGYIDISIFQNNIDEYNGLLYTGIVAEPTEVHKLLGEVMRDIGINLYADTRNRKIFGEQIRRRESFFNFDDGVLNNISASVDYDKRISAFYIRYGRVSPLEKLDEAKNYRSRLFRLNDDANQVLQKNSQEIRSHYSRWISSFQRTAANSLSILMIGRYGKPIRTLNAIVPYEFCPYLGQIGNIKTRLFENSQGQKDTVQMQVVQVDRQPGNCKIVFEEFTANFSIVEGDRIISIEYDQVGVNLRELHDTLFSNAPPDGTVVRFVGENDARLGGLTDVGDWSDTTNLDLRIENLKIYGSQGESGVPPNYDGGTGGDALYTRQNVELINCRVGAGGGGGGGVYNRYTNDGVVYKYFILAGGSGAGFPKNSTYPATDEFGSANNLEISGIKSGSGGNSGQPGEDATQAATISGLGGAPGVAIDGISFVTLTNTVVIGSTIN